jgi:fucose 4-O-acetylase-like acetyltransferase
MTQRLLFLNGLAIFAVVCNHVAIWGHIALFWWVGSIPQPEPNPAYVGSISYYALLTLSKLTIFAVPSFLFITGFFIAYTARGAQSTLTWKMVRTRLKWLLIPYFIWSLVIFVFNLRLGGLLPLSEYLRQLILGKADGTYYYIPLLCQFFLLSFVIVFLAKNHWRWLLVVSALIQIIWIASFYLLSFHITPFAIPFIEITFFPATIFFFTFGVVAGIHLEEFKQFLIPIKKFLPMAVVILGLVSIIEGDVFYRATNLTDHGGYHTLPTCLYGITIVLTFLAFYDVKIPFSKTFYEFGRRSFGIYLTHATFLGIVAHTIRITIPSLYNNLFLYELILIILGIGGPFLLMLLVAKSPLRGVYRYLFG